MNSPDVLSNSHNTNGLLSDGDVDWRKLKAPFYMRQCYILLYLAYISYAGGIVQGLLSLPILLSGLLLYSLATARLFFQLRRHGLTPGTTRLAMRQDLFMLGLGYIHDPYASGPTVVAGLVILLGNGLRHGPDYYRESAATYVVIILLAAWLREQYTRLGYPVDAAAVALFTIISIVYGQFLVSRLWQSRQTLLQNSRHDDVTGLLTRRAFRSLASEQLACGQGSLLYMDLDNFKQINDQYGHAAGDTTLLAVADIIRQHAPKHALCSRYGGDEYVLYLPQQTLPQARELAEELRHGIIAVSQRWPQAQLDASIGMTTGDHCKLDELLDSADRDMYQRKRSSRLQSSRN